MSTSRFGRVQKSMALVPLVLLSAAWTASLAGVGLTSAAVANGDGSTLPDGTTVPTQAIEAPASVTLPGVIAPAVANGTAQHVVETASTSGIPAAALAAYQRAETVINAADPSCHVPWQLIAAIGRVESDHGRFGGNTLNADGVATPGIYGIALDGSNGTAVIKDTDAGQYDNDAVYDRAVGPMQFIPSTWSVVGVDADGDAQRDPQDINDAALATAVYLCSGTESLDGDTGQRAAAYRYNHSQQYVDLVLSIMTAYMQGDYTAVPNGTTSASYFPNENGSTTPTGHHANHQPGLNPGNPNTTPGTPNDPTDGNDGDGDPTSGPTSDPTHPPTSSPTSNPTTEPPATNPADPITSSVGDVLTHAEAVVQCTLDGYNAVLDPAGWNQCIHDYTH